MNIEDKIEQELNSMTKGKAVKWVLILMVGFSAMGIAGSYLGLIGKAATAPSRVMSQALETDNIVQSYEWFYDVNAAYDARLSQVETHKGWLLDSDGKESRTLRIELGAMQQTCRDLATKYNANSQKMNKKYFKGWSLPHVLDQSTCT